jgi:hypothetical protein
LPISGATGGVAHLLVDRGFQRGGDVAVVDDLEAAAQCICHRAAGLARVGGRAQPGAQTVADAGVGEAFVEHLAGEEVVLHERAQRLADLVLAVRG